MTPATTASAAVATCNPVLEYFGVVWGGGGKRKSSVPWLKRARGVLAEPFFLGAFLTDAARGLEAEFTGGFFFSDEGFDFLAAVDLAVRFRPFGGLLFESPLDAAALALLMDAPS